MATSIVNSSTLAIRGVFQEVGVKRKLSELPPYTYTNNGHTINLQQNLFGDHLPYLISTPAKNSYTTDSFATSANKEIDFEIMFMPDYKLIDDNSLWLQIPVQESGGSSPITANFVEAWFDYRKSVYYLQNGKSFFEANLGNMLFEPALSMTQTQYSNYCQNVNHDETLDPLSCNKTVFFGTAGIVETQAMRVPCSMANISQGAYMFEFDGEYSIPIAYNATVVQAESAINSLSTIRRRGLTVVVTGYHTDSTPDISLSGSPTTYTVATDALLKSAITVGGYIGFAFYPAQPVRIPLKLHWGTVDFNATVTTTGNDNATPPVALTLTSVLSKFVPGPMIGMLPQPLAWSQTATLGTPGAFPQKIFYLRLPTPFDSQGLYLGAIRPDQPIICRIRTQDARKFGTYANPTVLGTFAIMTNPGLNLLMQCHNIPPDDKKEYNMYWNNPGRRWKRDWCYLYEPASSTALAYSGKSPRIKLDTLQDVICSKAILIPHFGRQFSGFLNVYGGLVSGEELNNTNSTNYFHLIRLGTPVSPAQIWLENANGVQIFTGNGKYTEWLQNVEMIRKGDTKLWCQNAKGYILMDFGDLLKQQYTQEVGALFKFTGEEFLVISDSGIGGGSYTTNGPTGSATASNTGLWTSTSIFLDIYAFSPMWFENTAGLFYKVTNP